MYFKSKKISLLILAVTSVACSRATFLLFADPEGPNLLIVAVAAAIIYFLSLALYFSNPFVRFSSNLTGLKRLMLGIVFQIIIVAVFFASICVFDTYVGNKNHSLAVTDFKNAEYCIDGTAVQLKNGFAEMETAPGSAAKIVTRYFGNEYTTDLDADGREDVAFLLTQEAGGSGVFYYVVAARNTEHGYVGSDGYLLGDRVAPQTIQMSSNPKHKNVIVVTFADRAMGEPMATQPSIGKSVYLKLDTASMMWGIVEPNFEGESR